MKASLRLRPKSIVGTPDPTAQGHTLVPINTVSRFLPKVYNVPPSSFYRYDEGARRVVAIVTPVKGFMPSSNWWLAWDACRECTKSIRRCRCSNGVSASEWLIREAADGAPKNTLPPPKKKRAMAPVPTQKVNGNKPGALTRKKKGPSDVIGGFLKPLGQQPVKVKSGRINHVPTSEEVESAAAGVVANMAKALTGAVKPKKKRKMK